MKSGKWMVTTKCTSTGRGITRYRANFVFVGAGGWALLMLQKAGIPQVNGYMALPVTGDWAVCQNPDVVKQHKVKVYAPGAPGAPPDAEDWTLIPAGVRAQIIKRDTKSGKGMLQFGTEVVSNDEGTIVGLLGASPGASTCVTIALDTLEKCFKNKPEFAKWTPQIKKVIPTWAPEDHSKLDENSIRNIYQSTATTLKINKK